VSSVSVVLSSSTVGLVPTVSLVVWVWWSSSISRNNIEGFVESLSSGIILLSKFLSMKPFEMASMSCIFPRFEGSPWVLWIVSLAGNYCLDKCWFGTFLEQVNGSMIIECDSSCYGKSFKFGYEDVKALFLPKSSELVECLVLPVGIGEGVFEILFKGDPMVFICFICSSSKACLEFDHLFFFPWFHHVSLHEGETGGDACSYIAHGFILPIGKVVDGKCMCEIIGRKVIKEGRNMCLWNGRKSFQVQGSGMGRGS